MKDTLILLAVGIFAICAYRAWQQWTDPASPPIVAVTPSPTPRPTPSLPPRHLTSEGTFAILDYASVRTKTGIVGFEPGQMVKFVSANREKGTLTVTDGTYDIELRPEQLTNDLDVAALARRRDEASQQQLRSIVATAQDEDAKARMAANVDAAKNIGRRPSGAVIGSSSTLDKGTTQVGVWYANPYSNSYYNSSYGSPYGSPYYYNSYGSPYYYLNR